MTQERTFAVNLTAALNVPAQPAWEKLAPALTLIAERPGSVCLTLHLEELQLPINATVSVPVSIRLEKMQNSALRLTIDATTQSTVFPRFEGTIAVTPTPDRHSRLDLDGFYNVPMGWIGKAIDSTLLRGSAIATLTEFLRRVASDLEDTVRRDELAHARAVLHQHA